MHPPMPHLSFFLASFTWNYALGMTWLAVPLYAASKGLSGAELGVLFSLPAVLQLAINLLGGDGPVGGPESGAREHQDQLRGEEGPEIPGVGHGRRARGHQHT